MRSVMVLSAAAGAGHIRAAQALVKAAEHAGVPARHEEVLQYTNSIFRKSYSRLYIDLIRKQPELLGWFYNVLDQPWRFQKRRLALDRLNTGRFIKMVRRENPDNAVCTHFLPAEILLHLKKKGKISMPVGLVVTDFDAHAMWLYKGVDWYFVACEETREYLVEMGIPRESIFVTGIPVDPVFAVPGEKKETRLELGLDADTTTILVSAGGFGVGPVEAIVRIAQKIEHDVQIVVICGRNDTLKEKLLDIRDTVHPLTIVGYTSEMNKWMAASDLLVGKAGGLTSSESFASGLVMVIVNPVPGQEERNSDHFLEEGAAVRCNNIPALAYKIDSLLGDPERMKKMRSAAKRLARPDAAPEIIRVIGRGRDA